MDDPMTDLVDRARALADRIKRNGRCDTCEHYLIGPGNEWCGQYDEPIYVQSTGDCEGWEDERG